MSAHDLVDSNALFDDLIDYSDNESVVENDRTNLTFLEPNIDIMPSTSSYYYYNFNNDTIKQMMGNSIELNNIVEQPQQCRISGSGVKDRRPIDPAPIIKLTILQPKNHIEAVVECPFYVVHVSLWSADKQQKYDLIDSQTRALMGSLVSTSSFLKDLNDERHYFFAFPDLSIRMTGQFRLNFSLIHLGSNRILKEVYSDVFSVYSAKSYPGMKESSELTKHLAKQGLKLTTRSQTKHKKE